MNGVLKAKDSIEVDRFSSRVQPYWKPHLDESTDVSSCSQLLVFVRYINSGDIKDEFLFCSALETTTKADDVMEKVSTFFQEEDLQWENVCGVCTDGAPAMLGSKSGFQSRVKKLAPQAKSIHCMIHRSALASKTLPASLQDVLESLIKIVNYIKTKALNTRLFKELCKDMNADHEVLLFYTAEQEALVRNPFCTELDVSSIPDEIQDEHLDLRNDSSARDLFKVKSVTQFWCGMYQSYSKISMIALRVLVPFASTYLCEAGFSTLVNMKTKNRNRLELDVGDDMRLSLTNVRPRISKLVAEMQHQASH
ncbi:zinc finger BED domain-containing protein 5-like [Palaemon carinicauda]|uniref:zinc finger BED domain-containing protein 5-like n=1 Tax=Palaemon carinicauda TaxID=392227 RepID=UPI0035B6654F